MILDNRVHRTIRISNNPITPTTVYPLVTTSPNNPYTVLLKVIGGIDTLVVTKAGKPVASIPLTKTYTPPNCPSPVASRNNMDCQWPMDIEDQEYRIVELQQNLIDSANDYIFVVAQTILTANPVKPVITNELVYYYNGLAITMDDGGFKVPPDLG
jgi:hypothetical protein